MIVPDAGVLKTCILNAQQQGLARHIKYVVDADCLREGLQLLRKQGPTVADFIARRIDANPRPLQLRYACHAASQVFSLHAIRAWPACVLLSFPVGHRWPAPPVDCIAIYHNKCRWLVTG